MKMTRLCNLAVTCAIAAIASFPRMSVSSEASIDGIIQNLFDKVKTNQVQHDENFVFGPFFWRKRRGLYESDVKLNFHGTPDITLLRESFRVYDNNMFATAWITSVLIEAYANGHAPKPTEDQIKISVEAIGNFHYKNVPLPNSVLTFWQGEFNESVNTWQSKPDNLLALFKMTDYFPWGLIERILSAIGLSKEAEYIKEIMMEKSSDLKAFQIPPDFDDSFVNLGLGALLYKHRSVFSQSFQAWGGNNSNPDSLFSALKQYAYRPFSTNSNVNTIDSRTYFYIRGFLEQAKEDGRDVALVTTWVQDIAGNRNMTNRGVGMPFNINNVDVTVSANVIYGITASVLSGLVNYTVLDDPDIQKIYFNTTAMLVWEMERDFLGRKDLALTYYPSLMEFYWFVSRTYNLLDRYTQERNTSLPPILKTTRQTLQNILRGHVTGVIVNSGQEEVDETFFDDFLGDGDVTTDGQPVIKIKVMFEVSLQIRPSIWQIFVASRLDKPYMDEIYEDKSLIIQQCWSVHSKISENVQFVSVAISFGSNHRLTGLKAKACHDKTVRGEDRIFTTAMAVNALVNIWTSPNLKSGQLTWARDAPSVVKETTKKASLWLTNNALGQKYKPWNVFFSGSDKGDASDPYYFPINRLECRNGTKLPLSINVTKIPCDVLLGMQGVVAAEKYDWMVNSTHFGKPTPTVFKGFNSGNDPLPFWSSEPYTYATAMLALTQTKTLISDNTFDNTE